MPTAERLEVLTPVQVDVSSLALDVEIIPLAGCAVERWRLLFEGFESLRIDRVGAGLPPLTRFVNQNRSPLYAPPADALWEIEHSSWLRPDGDGTTGEPTGRLHHLVVYEATRKRVWHIAAVRRRAVRIGAEGQPGAEVHPAWDGVVVPEAQEPPVENDVVVTVQN